MNKALGASGESLAANYLKKKAGLKIIERNWRCPIGEIDLVAQGPQGELVIVEVKTRSKIGDSVWESIGFEKQVKLARLARWYLKAKDLSLDTPVQFDAVVVLTPNDEVHHLPNAFWAEKEI